MHRSYGVITTGPAAMLLTTEDPLSHAETGYFLAQNTSLDGRPLVCKTQASPGIPWFCGALPSYIVPGKTYIGVVYWNAPFQGFPERGADTLVTCVSPDRCLQKLSIKH
jgi:hypothetical protein